MKLTLAIGLAMIVGAVALWRIESGVAPQVPVAPAVKKTDEVPPSSVSTESTEVFSRAFWRRPGPEDKILHAERREWTDENGLQKWEWFIAVDASPELLKYLRDDNTFGLSPAAAPPAYTNPPDWFRIPSSGFEFMTSQVGHFCLISSKAGGLIFASDSGSGFRPGAPAPVTDPMTADLASPPTSGRLPNSMPPKPTAQPR